MRPGKQRASDYASIAAHCFSCTKGCWQRSYLSVDFDLVEFHFLEAILDVVRVQLLLLGVRLASLGVFFLRTARRHVSETKAALTLLELLSIRPPFERCISTLTHMATEAYWLRLANYWITMAWHTDRGVCECFNQPPLTSGILLFAPFLPQTLLLSAAHLLPPLRPRTNCMNLLMGTKFSLYL